jgi:hypothetical protein
MFCKPDVSDVLKPDVLKPDVLKPDVLWVYRKKSYLPNERECPPTPSLPRRSFIAVVHQEMALCSGTIRNIVKPA